MYFITKWDMVTHISKWNICTFCCEEYVTDMFMKNRGHHLRWGWTGQGVCPRCQVPTGVTKPLIDQQDFGLNIVIQDFVFMYYIGTILRLIKLMSDV